jgi:glycosyltransferase involved in cell wall biosynthesis
VTRAGRPTVSVVIPTRNRLPLLREAIDSVERQSFPDWEAVVVDDASDDETSSWLEHLNDRRIRPIRLDRHSERSVVRNRGLQEAQGDFVLFLDDDDRLTSAALARLCGALGRRPDAVAAVGANVRFDPTGRRERAPHPRFGFTRMIWRDVLAGWDSGSGQALFRADRVREVGGWNEELSYWELGDLWFRVSRLGPVVFVPATVLELRLHPGQAPPGPGTRDPRPDLVRLLPARERGRAKRLVAARQLVHDGDDARFLHQHRRAVGCYLRAVRMAPLLLRSPLTRPDLVANMAREMARLLVEWMGGGRAWLAGALGRARSEPRGRAGRRRCP